VSTATSTAKKRPRFAIPHVRAQGRRSKRAVSIPEKSFTTTSILDGFAAATSTA
jgi:hypothetical protein